MGDGDVNVGIALGDAAAVAVAGRELTEAAGTEAAVESTAAGPAEPAALFPVALAAVAVGGRTGEPVAAGTAGVDAAGGTTTAATGDDGDGTVEGEYT